MIKKSLGWQFNDNGGDALQYSCQDIRVDVASFYGDFYSERSHYDTSLDGSKIDTSDTHFE